MTNQSLSLDQFHLYAYLPFVQLARETTIQMGPIVFWPASKGEEVLGETYFEPFSNYLKQVGQVKAVCKEKDYSFVDTVPLILEETTCVSISKNISPKKREFLLIDGLYLLFFACTFRNLYYGQEIPSFNAFRKMIPASEEFIKDKEKWEKLYIKEKDREDAICLHLIDPDICQALGKALESIYLPAESQSKDEVESYKRLVRSIRYLVDRFFSRFVNLFQGGLNFPEELFEPEDVIFIASSFETLFHIDKGQEASAEFKFKMRPLLHLKYSTPVEFFWKWVDDFYSVKRRLLQGDTFLDPLFRINPNFEVSHILLGIKLFVYSVYYYLFKFKLLQSTHSDPYTPPDFKWIHPEEVLLFFWTEPSVLTKIHLFIKQAEKGTMKEEDLADLHLLTTLFVSLYDRYYMSDHLKSLGTIRFCPSPVSALSKEGTIILEKLHRMHENDSENILLQHVHPYFIKVLEDRLQEKKTLAA